ncbi:MAG: AAA family ATPase [Candidatus Limnocylindria bacterium]
MTAATTYTAPSEPVARLLSRLDGIRRNGSGWMARCPAHADRQASLSVTAGDDGRALLYCHAGCNVEAVTTAAGIATADLFEPRDTPPPAARRKQAAADRPPILYPIRGTDGEVAAIHVRQDTADGKRVTWRLPDGTSGLGGTPTADLPLFGSESLPSWDATRPVVIVEGEKAAVALREAGFRGLGTSTGAASAPSVAILQSLRGHHVILWADADPAGRKHMHRVAERLAGIAASLRVVTWPDAPEHGDAADMLAAGSASEVDALLAAAASLNCPGPVLVTLSSVQRERVEWIWPGYLARGKLHMLDGDPGLGKSTAALDIAARLSRGAIMPDGSPGTAPAGVVILTAEDGIADTVRPRLEAAGADLERIVALTGIVDGDGERMPGLPLDLAAIEAGIRQVDAALVIVDPIMAYLPADVNAHRDQDVRRALAPTAALAERTRAAILAVRHLNKSGGAHAVYRGGGSIGIIGAARVGLLVARDPDDDARRIVAVTKNNLAAEAPSLAFQLVPDDTIGAARVEWLGESVHGASALLSIRADDPEEGGALAEAVEVLRTILADGPVSAKDAEREATNGAGVSHATLLRARKAAGVIAEKVGRPGASGQFWQWRLEPKALTESRRYSPSESESLRENVSAFGESEPPRIDPETVEGRYLRSIGELDR